MNRDRLPAEAVLAANRIASYIRETPLEPSPAFSEACGANVWLKLENLQITGSFKLRGALNKLLTMSDSERDAGIVTASSGNHGAAVAWSMQQLGIHGCIFVPNHGSTAKVDAIRRYGADVRHFGDDGLETESHAREYARAHDMTYISPYNDPAIVAGQGSCGVEISRQLAQVDVVFVAVGGGGLISGVAALLRSVNPGVTVIGCQPSASAVMAKSVRAGRILDLPSEPTLSDGTAGGIESDTVTFALCRELVDEFVLVSELQIGAAMQRFIDTHHLLLEGAAGVALAALSACQADICGKNAVAIICGGNISRDVLKQVI